MIRDLDIDALSLACSPDINLAAFWITIHQHLTQDSFSHDPATMVMIGRLMLAYEVLPGEERLPTIPLNDIVGKLRIAIHELVNMKVVDLADEPRLKKYVENLAFYYGPRCVHEYAMAFLQLASLIPEGALTAEVCENLSSYVTSMKEIINDNERII